MTDPAQGYSISTYSSFQEMPAVSGTLRVTSSLIKYKKLSRLVSLHPISFNKVLVRNMKRSTVKLAALKSMVETVRMYNFL